MERFQARPKWEIPVHRELIAHAGSARTLQKDCKMKNGLRRIALGGLCLLLISGRPGLAEELLFDYFGKAVPADCREYYQEGYKRIAADEKLLEQELPLEAKSFELLGFVPYVVSYLELVQLETKPRAEQLTNRIAIQATPGEIETGAFAIYALKKIEGMGIRVTDLTSKQGESRIRAKNIDVRNLFYARRVGWKEPTFKELPIILEKLDAVDVKTGQSQMYYVTVQVPQDASPGVYTAQISLKAKDSGSFTYELELTVLPIKLQKPDVTYAFWYHDSDVREDLMDNDLMAMGFAGMNSVMVVYGLGVDPIGSDGGSAADEAQSPVDGKVSFDFTRLEYFMGLYAKAGMSKPLIYNVMLGHLIDGGDAYRKAFLVQMHAKAGEKGWPGYIWSIGDENDATGIGTAVMLGKSIKRHYPGDLLKQTIVYPKNWNVYGDLLDITVWAAYINSDILDKSRRLSKFVGNYNGTGYYEISALDNRLFFGLWGWDENLDHLEQWVYNGPLFRKDEPYNDFGAYRGNCHHYCYPAEDGILPTVGYYGIMEGIDDARYIYTLEQLVEKASKLAGDETMKRLVSQARSFFATWRQRIDMDVDMQSFDVVPDEFTIRREKKKIGATEYTYMRQTCIDLILRIQARLDE